MTAGRLLGAALAAAFGLLVIFGLHPVTIIILVALLLLVMGFIGWDETRHARASADAEGRTIFEEALRHAQDRAGKS